MRILIVEDNDADVNLTLAALWDARGAHEIHVAANGDEAIEFLRAHARYAGSPLPDLVLLDLNLPNKDGFDVLGEMKADPKLRTIPVVVVSGSEQDSDIAHAYDLQVAAYVVKPVNVDDYFSAIRAVKELWFHRAAPRPKESEASA